MMKKKQNKIILYFIILVGVFLVVGGIYYSSSPKDKIAASFGVYDYEPRDKERAIKFFNDAHYLVTVSDLHDMNHLFDTKSPNHVLREYFGKLAIKVVRENDQLVGFITYYIKGACEGKIQLLVVGKEYRRRGYGTKLIKAAESELYSQGASHIEIAVRRGNKLTARLYERLQYKCIGSNERFYFYEKKL